MKALLALLTVFGLVFPSLVWAGGYCGDNDPPFRCGNQGPPGPQGPAGLDGKDFLHDNDAWTDNDLDQMFSASTAMAGLDFDSTTNKLQLGIALGGYGSETQGAVGIGYVVDNDKVGDVLFSLKTTFEEVGHDDHRPWVASAIWKIKIE